jgi:glycerophosphoryl diester phosphodiesterase
VPRPELIAHRGASRERPENTLPAFQRAVELGADGAEFDVHLHPDGVIRVHHDPLPASEPGPTARKSRDGGPPTLEAVLKLLAGAGLTAYCELKGAGTPAGAIEALKASGGKCAVHAFDHRMVAEALHIAPGIPRGVLESSYPVDALHALRTVQGRDLWRHWPFIDEALVTEAHAAGARVIAWTVNDPAQIERLAKLGVDGLCTDDIALARHVLGA